MKTEDGSIISKCLNGDHDAFGLLVDKYKDGVYALAYSRLHNTHNAEDVSQEVFIKVYEKLHTLRRWDRFAGWLYRMTIRLCINWLEAQSICPDREHIEDNSSEIFDNQTMDSYHAESKFNELHESLDSLSEEHREVIILHYFSGMTSSEISKFVGVSPDAIRRRLMRARSMLKEEILNTISIAFDERKLHAGFTPRILEMTRYTRIHPIPKEIIIPWGASLTGAIIVAILAMSAGLMIVKSYYDVPAMSESSGVIGPGQVPVYVTDKAEIESGGGTSMLSGKKIGAFVTVLAALAVLSNGATAEDAPGVAWQQAFGGSNYDAGSSGQQTSDGGYVVVGSIRSFGAGNLDVYLVKTDPSGNSQWQKTFGGANDDGGNSIQQTSDGGYIIAGYTKSFGIGNSDIYLVKTDALGNSQWQKMLGSGDDDVGNFVQQTSDGGYIITGYTGNYLHDVYLLKVDTSGNLLWQKTFGTAGGDEVGNCVRQTSDGGYIIAGYTYSWGVGGYDFYLVKTDASGNFQWQNTFGSPSFDDDCFSVQQTLDGGYIIAGLSDSLPFGDFYLVKVDASGNLQWQKKFGGTEIERGFSVQQTLDGGYVIAGYAVVGSTVDVYLVKTDTFGNPQWEKTFGGTNNDEANFVQQTSDGGYIIIGRTNSSGSGNYDVYLAKIMGPIFDANTITASAGAGGSITPSGAVTVNYGADQTFNIIPSTGYHVVDVMVDGSSVGVVTIYTFINVIANHTISATFAMENVSPTVDAVIAPIDPVIVNTTISAMANFTDPNLSDTHTATWNWGDGTPLETINIALGSRVVNGSHTYTAAGVYTITLTVSDSIAEDQATYQYVVVYDPSAGFVTGGGWINSPVGAYIADSSLTGKANFGFVSKYQKGANIPTGNTEFNFKVASMNFRSTAYEWLVVAGAKAKYKGTGTINNAGNYGFMLSTIDGQINGGGGTDKFRIKMWDRNDNDKIVYDNQMNVSDDADPTTVIGGGSIVIHKSDDKAAPAMIAKVPDRADLLPAFPNPANPEVWIPYQLSEDTDVSVRIYASSGQLVRTLELGHKSAGLYLSNSKSAYWDGRNESGEKVVSGIYFYNIKAGNFVATKKLVIAK